MYTLLGVPSTATKADIKKAYYKMALEHHPDKAGPGNEDKFKAIQEAHTTLMDDEKRELYDALGKEEMRKYSQVPGASVVAMNPALVILYPILSLLTASCVLSFLALLSQKIDNDKPWPWRTHVFAPLWVLAVVLALIGLRILGLIPLALKDREGDEKNKHRKYQAVGVIIFVNIMIALLIACFVSVSRALDGLMSWRDAFIPIFIFFGITVLITLLTMDFDSFVRRMAMEEGVDAAEIDRDSVKGKYVLSVIAQIINILSQILFVAFLYINIQPQTETFSYYAVFAPIIVRISLPVLLAIIAVIVAGTAKPVEKACGVFAILLLSSLSISTVVMIAAKCENSRLGDPKARPTVAQICIPAFIGLSGSLIGSLIITCGALTHVREQGFGGSDDDEVDDLEVPFAQAEEGVRSEEPPEVVSSGGSNPSNLHDIPD